MNILQACTTYFGLAGPTWANWRALLGGAFGCPLTAEQTDVFRMLTGQEPLTRPCRELWCAIGRRGGKNRAAAAVVVYLALFKKWTLAAGEIGAVIVLASDRAQAKVAFRYILGSLKADEQLWLEVVNVTSDSIVLESGIEITIVTADNAAVRGRTVVACVIDEYAFWLHEQALEVLRGVRPGMATQPQAMLIVISSVYAANGPFSEARRAHHGVADPRVVYAVATSRQMNPTLSSEFIEAELARDPIGNAAEYLSIERSDVEAFIDAPLYDSAQRSEPPELPPITFSPDGAHVLYGSGGDVSGGRGDATAFAVTHNHRGRVIVDAVRRWPAPHDPLIVAREAAAFLKSYGLASAVTDQYGAELTRSIYQEVGITLIAAEVTRSEAYLHFLPLLTSGRVELPPEPRLRQEFLGLERRTSRSGRDTVDHRPGAHSHDDMANCVAIAIWRASRTRPDGENHVFFQLLETAVGTHGPVNPYLGPPGSRPSEYRHPADYRDTDPISERMSYMDF